MQVADILRKGVEALLQHTDWGTLILCFVGVRKGWARKLVEAQVEVLRFSQQLAQQPQVLQQLVGKVGNLEAKMDTLEAKLEAKMDTLEAKLEAKMDNQEAKMEAKMDVILRLVRSTTDILDDLAKRGQGGRV